ncbi:hypothetical protein [Paenibacillus brevis]|uniref:Uncharacterized protein n=1 Tax=Paenibacillus brevis TaxID=2841508 RepID=A0ABS6FSN6_9BACL|nr:hypothetical protein [Paenibacillus brevis]MBU5673238.1 hypothetical protein [Paenibacillus brevis]
MNEVLERRAKREGKVTPKACIEHLMQAIEAGGVETVIFVARSPDGIIHSGWSKTQHTELLGLLECGKNHVICEMCE